jgi:hypothetical protein
MNPETIKLADSLSDHITTFLVLEIIVLATFVGWFIKYVLAKLETMTEKNNAATLEVAKALTRNTVALDASGGMLDGCKNALSDCQKDLARHQNKS